ATVPSDVIIIRNKLGTAPGFIFERDGKAVIALPGVPSQMEQMLVDDVIPFLEKTYENSKKVFHRSLYFCQMNENQIDPLLRQMEKKYQGLEIGVCPSYGKLAVYLKGQNEKSLISSQKEIKEAFLTHCYSDSESKIQMALHQTLLEKGRTLSLAESCTGGKIASMITSLPEASLYFLGGVVAYSNLLKQKSLGVLESTLHQFGAVSQETVCEMAKGIEALTSADYSIAVSGVAGPSGGTKDKPVGTIWGAISQKDKILFSGKITAKGILHRTTLINYTANYLISSLWRWIHYNIPPFTHE
ncbi:MAG: nicotinamide-nucleotide amidohydrolase family protein, partial [Simkaniaceae bacterium]|nr:nicotinamide-nucleotide amidohydrolase family protein [Simkaniaceae bacterium]